MIALVLALQGLPAAPPPALPPPWRLVDSTFHLAARPALEVTRDAVAAGVTVQMTLRVL